jgi:hypothetical protein
VILLADVKQAIDTKELRATMAATGSKKKPRRAAVSEVGDRIVAAAERLFGKHGYRHLMAWTSRRAWKAKVKAAFARAAQAEYEEALKESDIGIGYLAIKPRFGRAAWIEDARDSVTWGRQVGLYLLHRLRGAGHDLRTVSCHYWWTNHDGMCPCDAASCFAQTPEHWLFQCSLTEAPRAQFMCDIQALRGRPFRLRLEAMGRNERWAEVMGWLDGRGGWSNRGGMLMAVLDLVYRTTKRRV